MKESHWENEAGLLNLMMEQNTCLPQSTLSDGPDVPVIFCMSYSALSYPADCGLACFLRALGVQGVGGLGEHTLGLLWVHIYQNSLGFA